MGAAVQSVADSSIDPLTGKKKVQPVAQPAVQPAQPAAPKPVAPAAPIAGQPAAAAPMATYAPASPVQPAAPMASGSAASTAQASALGQLQAAQNAPDRQTLAMQTFQNIQANGEPAYQQQLRGIGSAAAKYGRIGAGLTTNELTSAELARQRTLDTTASQLSTDAAGQTMADRLALTNAALGQYSAYSGADQASADLAQRTAQQEAQLKLDTATGMGQLGVNEGRLALDTSGQSADIRQKQAQLALDSELGKGTLDVNQTRNANDLTIAQGQQGIQQQQVANQVDQFGRSFGETQLTNDRNFALDDRTAAALSALNGTDQTNSGDGTSATNLPTVTGGAAANPVDLTPPPQAADPRTTQLQGAIQQQQDALTRAQADLAHEQQYPDSNAGRHADYISRYQNTIRGAQSQIAVIQAQLGNGASGPQVTPPAPVVRAGG